MLGVTGWNTWNVYTKWFQSTPPVSNHQLWGAFLIVCFLPLCFLFFKSDVFQEKLNATILWTTFFFCGYLAALAILKSIVYLGWKVWEPAFTLFILDRVIFTVTLPLILSEQKAKRQ
ncbi:MAG: hypothetical protein EXS63_05630 [Candidatus Omnitrophica bacterium]|nr:hypothetical protein [Candidatus Omnitrophota bacterium]